MVFLETALWGILATSTLLIGAFIAFRARPSSRAVGLVMGFGAGVHVPSPLYGENLTKTGMIAKECERE